MEESELIFLLKSINTSLLDISESLVILADNSGGAESNHISELNHTLKLIHESIEDKI